MIWLVTLAPLGVGEVSCKRSIVSGVSVNVFALPLLDNQQRQRDKTNQKENKRKEEKTETTITIAQF
jgi:hypothetical protein